MLKARCSSSPLIHSIEQPVLPLTLVCCRIRKSVVYGKEARNKAACQWAVSSLFYPFLDSRNEVISPATEIIHLATLQIPWIKQGVSQKLRGMDDNYLVPAFQVESFPSICFWIEGQVFILQLKGNLHVVSTQGTGVQTETSLYS